MMGSTQVLDAMAVAPHDLLFETTVKGLRGKSGIVPYRTGPRLVQAGVLTRGSIKTDDPNNRLRPAGGDYPVNLSEVVWVAQLNGALVNETADMTSDALRPM